MVSHNCYKFINIYIFGFYKSQIIFMAMIFLQIFFTKKLVKKKKVVKVNGYIFGFYKS